MKKSRLPRKIKKLYKKLIDKHPDVFKRINELLMKKIIIFAITLVALASCNVTRMVTTSAEHFQKGDTTTTIITKTIETYDATKK